MASEPEPIPLQTLSRRGEHSTRVVSHTTSKDGDDINQDEPHHEGLSLPPMDKGFAAWSFGVAGFVLETLVWGFGFTNTFFIITDAPNLGGIHARLWSCGARIHATPSPSRSATEFRWAKSMDKVNKAALGIFEEPSVHLYVFNFSSIIGQIIFGHACDVAPYQYVIVISGAGAALATYLLWGFAHSLGLIFAFVVVFGSLSGGFASVWPAASVDIAGSEQSAFLNVYGLLTMTKGIAAVTGPLIAAALYHPEQAAVRNTYSGYGFRDVTVFVGSMMVATAAGGVATKWARRVV
ncbi:MFS-1 domain protein, partial [Rhizoctonia solani AG-3 Rhs1AP]